MPGPRMRLADDHDRPWTKSGGRAWPRWSVTVWLVAVNVAVFVLQEIFPKVEELCDFTIIDAIHRLQLWRWVSYMFLHSRADAGHLIFNMLALWFFGPIVEERIQGPRFLGFYLLCGIGGAFVYWVLYRMDILYVHANSHLLGASGAVLGIVAGGAKVAPDRQMRLLFPPVTLRLVTIGWGFFAVAVIVIFFAGPNAGGEAAHLGGLIVGFILIRNQRWLGIGPTAKTVGGKKFWKPGDPPEKFFRSDVER